ncbi:SET domain-containing protein 4-like isoform X2 [Antedon mediterranea]
MISLLQWMKCHGFEKQHLKPAIFKETGRGLMANKSFKPGDTIISIPADLLITTSTVLRTSIGPVIQQNPDLTPRQILCVFLILEKHKASASSWCPYISQLPDTYTTPSYFTDDELKSLPKHLLQMAIFQVETVKDEFQKVQSFSQALGKLDPCYPGLLTYEAFKWAWFVVNTRSVYMDPSVSQWKSSCEIDSYALAPFLDLLNHSAKANVTAGFKKKSNCYEIVTHNTYAKYDQVFICYGPHGNENLLLEYGFIVPANPNTSVNIPFDLIKDLVNREQLDARIQFLKENFEVSWLSKLTCGADGVSWPFIVTLRVLCTHSADRSYWQRITLGLESMTTDELNSIKHMADCILQSILIEITKKIGNLCSGEHFTLLDDFLKEQLHIVATSKNLLDQLAVSF